LSDGRNTKFSIKDPQGRSRRRWPNPGIGSSALTHLNTPAQPVPRSTWQSGLSRVDRNAPAKVAHAPAGLFLIPDFFENRGAGRGQGPHKRVGPTAEAERLVIVKACLVAYAPVTDNVVCDLSIELRPISNRAFGAEPKCHLALGTPLRHNTLSENGHRHSFWTIPCRRSN